MQNRHKAPSRALDEHYLSVGRKSSNELMIRISVAEEESNICKTGLVKRAKTEREGVWVTGRSVAYLSCL